MIHNEKIFVLAGNYEQFQMFRAQLIKAMAAEHTWFRISNIIYINGPDTLRGIQNPWGYKVGTWSERNDIWDITTIVLSRGSSIKNDFIEVQL